MQCGTMNEMLNQSVWTVYVRTRAVTAGPDRLLLLLNAMHASVADKQLPCLVQTAFSRSDVPLSCTR